MTNTIVLEAAFLPESRQRDWLAVWADLLNAKIEYIELTAPKAVLLERIEHDYRQGRHLPTQKERDEARRYHDARMMVVKSALISIRSGRRSIVYNLLCTPKLSFELPYDRNTIKSTL